MDAASVARDLYRGPPEGFVAARTAAAKKAKIAGDADLARTIASMRKPSAAAWALNRLAGRDQGDGLADVPRLHAEFEAAQSAGDGRALRDLDGRRRVLFSQTTRDASAIGADNDVALSAAALRELEQTLRAGVADRAAAAAVTSGVLVRGLNANGYDPVDIDDAVAVPIPVPDAPVSGARTSKLARAPDPQRSPVPANTRRPSSTTKPATKALATPPTTDAKRRAAERAVREADRAVLDAEQSADDVEAEREELAATADALQRRLGDLRAEGDELVERLAQIRDDTADVKRGLSEAIRSRSEAERAVRRTSRSLEAAHAARDRLH